MHDGVLRNSLPRESYILYSGHFASSGCNFQMVNFEPLLYCLLGDWKTDCLIYRVREEHMMFLEKMSSSPQCKRLDFAGLTCTLPTILSNPKSDSIKDCVN